MKKVLLALILALASFAFVSRGAYAANAPWTPGYDMPGNYIQALTSGDPNMWNWIANLWMGGLETINTAVNGSSVSIPTPGSTDAQPQRFVGLLGITGSALGTVYRAQTPFATTTYLADLNPVKQVYAADTGAGYLTFVLEIWKIFRNLAYLVLTVVLIAVGFLIMFRQKIDPRTEVTLVSALPKMVMTLILITLSYAISGFMYDLAAVFTELINSVFTTFPNTTSTTFPQNFAFYDIIGKFSMRTFGDAFSGKIGSGPLIPTSVPVVGGLGAGTLFSIVFGMAMFTVMIQLLMTLIRYFAQWFLLTIIGPLILAVGGLPSSGELISWWLRNLLVSVIVFPATYAILNLAFYVREVLAVSPVAAGLPELGFFGIPDPGVLNKAGISPGGQFIGNLICWGMVLASATVPQIVDNLVSGDIDKRVEGVDAGRVIRGLPLIGSLLGG